MQIVFYLHLCTLYDLEGAEGKPRSRCRMDCGSARSRTSVLVSAHTLQASIDRVYLELEIHVLVRPVHSVLLRVSAPRAPMCRSQPSWEAWISGGPVVAL